MARPSAAGRNLTPTEELEKLEQSITLTLQEIDHNFSKAHRIVTTSILPLVEQYGENSRAVWEASKFWKQFFEASANVSLSGYEELTNGDDNTTVDESTAMREDSSIEASGVDGKDATVQTRVDESEVAPAEVSMLDDGEITGSTPRPPVPRTVKTEFAGLESPYEAMKREMKNQEDQDDQTAFLGEDEDSTVFLAQRTAQLPDMSMTPENLERVVIAADRSGRKQKDPLLHRVLDKNYRIQATPHKPALRMSPLMGQEATAKRTENSRPVWQDDSPMSSPEMAVPTLRSEIFTSPHKGRHHDHRHRLGAAPGGAPRTPGVSVQTPATGKKKTRDVFAANDGQGKGERRPYEIDWEDDDETDLQTGMSPPKTIQFALAPNRLMQTPAREASRRMVDDILLDAGADPESSEYSPTMVKMNADILNDSF